MLFNSIEFAIFLPIVFFLYWFITSKSLKLQNTLILVASYLFYGWWDWRFLSLIFFSTVVDYFVGILLADSSSPVKRKALLWTSIVVNIGFLGFFKYYNFFIENFVAAFSFFGTKMARSSLQIVLPVGISFYTFQTLSYTIDVYRKKLEPTKDFIAFSSFVCFFPQLVAGPIERATNLLPQFYKQRVFNYSKAVDGLRQILWGLFKKVVIADNCAYYVDQIFSNPIEQSGSNLVVGAVLFTIQGYGDFSGYSDIAIGTSKLFGFDLKRNFNFPFFSRNISEFWRRWHISLMSWFKDYLYIPLGGSHGSKLFKFRNIFIVFFISGLWHGANWNYITWGVLNGIYFIPIVFTRKKPLESIDKENSNPKLKEFLSMLFTFCLVVISFIFIRVENSKHLVHVFSNIFSYSLWSIPGFKPLYLSLTIILFFITEWAARDSEFVLDKVGLTWKKPLRLAAYFVLTIAILWPGTKAQEFIYFQF